MEVNGSDASNMAGVFDKMIRPGPAGGRRKRMERMKQYRNIVTEMPISKSDTTLKALRDSLIAEGLPPKPAPPAKASSSKKKKASTPATKGPASKSKDLTDVFASQQKAQEAQASVSQKAVTDNTMEKQGTSPARTLGKKRLANNNEAARQRMSTGKASTPPELSKEQEVPSQASPSRQERKKTPVSRKAKPDANLKFAMKPSLVRHTPTPSKRSSSRSIPLNRGPQSSTAKGGIAIRELESGLFRARETLLQNFIDINPAIKAKVQSLGVITSLRGALIQLVADGSLSMSESEGVLMLFRTKLEPNLPDPPATPSMRRPTREEAMDQHLQRQARTHATTRDKTVADHHSKRNSERDQKDASLEPEISHTPGNPVDAIRGSTANTIETVSTDDLHLIPLEQESLKVPSLAYGLERVLFNPGVYHLQDPRSRVFNFDPYLQTIMPVDEFDFNALKQYVTSSRDQTLLSKARTEKKKYTGSTSSMTSALAHFHFLLSQWRPINTSNLSKMFPVEFQTFTGLQRGPVSVFLRWRDGAYAIDADKQFDTANILSMLGKSMEKLLTLSTDDFEKYRKENSDQISQEERDEAEAFHYTTIGDFLLRSQLDAYDPRLPGTGMFDLKTRAVISVRMDTDAYEEGRGYEIKGRHGEWESYEREYYDMIRSAFLKYSLQVRMGRMDGIFVAYHNTQRIFGFQYISLPELDYALHGTENTTLGDSEFKLSLELLNKVLDKATAKYPEQSLRIHFETRNTKIPYTYCFAEPITEQRIEDIQATNKSKVEKFEREVLGLVTGDGNEEEQQKGWETIRASIEESIEQDETDPEGDLSNLDSDSNGLAEDNLPSTAFDEGEEEEEEDEQVIDEDLEEHEEDEEEIEEEGETTEEDGLTTAEDNAEDETGEVDAENSGDDVEEVETDETEPPEQVDEPEQDATLEEAADEITDADESIEQGEDEDVSDTDSSVRFTNTLPIRRISGPATEMLAMTIAIRNKVNGVYVERPENLSSTDKWEVEYALGELKSRDRIATIYSAMKFRRKMALTKSVDLKTNTWNNQFLQSIKTLSKQGKEWRKKQDALDRKTPKRVLDGKDGGSEVWPTETEGKSGD